GLQDMATLAQLARARRTGRDVHLSLGEGMDQRLRRYAGNGKVEDMRGGRFLQAPVAVQIDPSGDLVVEQSFQAAQALAAPFHVRQEEPGGLTESGDARDVLRARAQ